MIAVPMLNVMGFVAASDLDSILMWDKVLLPQPVAKWVYDAMITEWSYGAIIKDKLVKIGENKQNRVIWIRFF